MYNKMYITEAEFDSMNWHGQKNYLYCLECGLFYNKEELGHNCNHGVDEGRVIKLKLMSAYGNMKTEV